MLNREVNSKTHRLTGFTEHGYLGTSKPVVHHLTWDTEATERVGAPVISNNVYVVEAPLFPSLPVQTGMSASHYEYNESAVLRWFEKGDAAMLHQEVSLFPFIDGEVRLVLEDVLEREGVSDRERRNRIKSELPNCIVSPTSGLVLQTDGQERFKLHPGEEPWVSPVIREGLDTGMCRMNTTGSPPYFFEFDYFYGTNIDADHAVVVASMTVGVEYMVADPLVLSDEVEQVLVHEGGFLELTKLVNPYLYPQRIRDGEGIS